MTLTAGFFMFLAIIIFRSLPLFNDIGLIALIFFATFCIYSGYSDSHNSVADTNKNIWYTRKISWAGFMILLFIIIVLINRLIF
ncbi:hypothetical protein KDK_33310 [Dictyobacter kobayashii]|uniref:Uncharacterized protein n=1 Tax=Dictyobacter kobayashii TaxID=2014872 RepID=A0A402AK79_9CHLR|nr:hypothetical protein KDK_33310 [Dictyobacter kobayashii]